MNIISISKKNFDELKQINRENNIYEFKYNGKNKIVKLLFQKNSILYSNQLYTISMLNEYKQYLPTNFCVPDSILCVDNSFEAIIEDAIPGQNLSIFLRNQKINPQDKIHYLKEIGKILIGLEKLRKITPLNQIYINDLNESNFIINQSGKLSVIDLDSCKIFENEPFPAKYLTPYSLLNNVEAKYKINKTDNSIGYVYADENTDIYCYIITILNYLYGKNINNLSKDEYYEYLNYLEHIKFNKNLINTFSKIIENSPNENPIYYLDEITNEQVEKANKIVYKKVKG